MRPIDAESLKEKYRKMSFGSNNGALVDMLNYQREKMIQMIDEEPTLDESCIGELKD